MIQLFVCFILKWKVQSIKIQWIYNGLTVLINSFLIQTSYSQEFIATLMKQNSRILIFALVLFSISGIVYALTNYLLGNFLLILGTVIIIYGNSVKVASRGIPIILDDLTTGLLKEVIFDMILSQSRILVCISVGLVGLCIFYLARTAPILTVKIRVILLSLGLSGLGLFIYRPVEVLSQFNVNMYLTDRESNLKVNGPGIFFITSRSSSSMPKPEDYSKQRMDEIVASLKKEYGSEKKKEDQTPNIIFILSESFSDPTLIEGTEWENNPIPTISSLQKENGGNLLSPVFGGGTANVEFSILSGFTNEFFNPTIVPFNYLAEDRIQIPSVIDVVSNLGYDTTAIHPYKGTSYKRDVVFKDLGFSEFKELSYFEKNTEVTRYYSEGFVSDNTFVESILTQLRKGKNPQFIHGVSMQNHFPYTEKFKGSLSEEDKNRFIKNLEDFTFGEALAIYARGLKGTDDAIMYLLSELEKEVDPVYVLFYGDHLPALTSGFFDEVRIKTKNNQSIGKFMSPYFFWSNTESAVQTNPLMNNPEFLGNQLMRQANIKLPIFYQFLETFGSKVPSFKEGIYFDATGKEQILSEEEQELITIYNLLQYDNISGEQHAREIFK